MLNINIKNLSIIALILSFFISTSFAIVGYSVNIFVPLLYFIIFLCIFNKPIKYFNSYIDNFFYKRTPFYYLMLYFVATIVTSLFSALICGFHFFHFLMYTIAFYLQVILIIWAVYEIVYRYISKELLLKIFIGTFYFVLVMGLVDISAHVFHIAPLQEILKYIPTRWIILHKNFVKVTVGTIPRMQSIFDEPGQFGWMIFLCSPLILTVYLNKIKVFKKNFIDSVVRKTILPMMYIDLLWTFSPIMLVYTGAASTIIILIKLYELYKYKPKTFIKVFSTISMIAFIVIVALINVDESLKSAFSRINTVLSNMRNINNLILAEQSLGTRIGTMINNMVIFTKHPIIGVGLGQMTPHMQVQLAHSPVVLTPELLSQYLNNNASYSGVIYRVFCENGLIGFILFSLFFLKIINNIRKCKKYVHEKNNLIILNGFLGSTIAVFALFFYDIPFNNTFPWAILGMTIAITKRIYEDENTIRS